MSRVLIVDDEEAYRRYLSLRLRRDGHEVEIAETAAQALARGRRLKPHILVVDWVLDGGASGVHVFESLRRESADLRAVLITGYPGDAVRAEVDRVQIDKLLLKPFALDELSSIVSSMEPGEG